MPEKFEKKLQEEKEKATEKPAQSASLELETEVIKKELPEEKESDVFVADVFDPEEELEKIKKLPREEKREALREYKEKLAEQKEKLAEMQAYFVTLLRGNPDISLKEMSEEAGKFENKIGLGQSQKIIVRTILVQYKRKHEKVREIREKYPDDRELYKKLFNKEPKGKVEIIEGPMTLYFRCYNSEDYALIYSQAFLSKRELTDQDIAVADMSGGVSISTSLIKGLEGTIIAENVPKVVPESQQRVYKHEEQHAFKKLFREMEGRISLEWLKFKTPEQVRLFMSRYFRLLRESAEDRAKDELLAYLKSGTSPEKTLQLLTKSEEEGGLYDYLKIIKDQDVKKVLKKFSNNPVCQKIIRKAASEVLEKEYFLLLRRGVNSYLFLTEKLGYSPEKAVAVLIKEPLVKWLKTVRRLNEQRKNKK